MLVAYYVIGATLVAWLAHSCYKAIARKYKSHRFGTSPHPACAHCGNAIGIFRRLARHHFCCGDHERTYWVEMDKIGIQRLHDARIAAPMPIPRDEIVAPAGENSKVAAHAIVTPILRQPQAQKRPPYRAPKSSRSQGAARIPRREIVTNVWMLASMLSATLAHRPTPETTSPDLP